MEHNNSVRARYRDIGYQVITVLVTEHGAVCTLRGPRVDEDEASAGSRVNPWGVAREVPGDISSILSYSGFYGIEWLLYPIVLDSTKLDSFFIDR
jgi:hypothetical protein